MNNLNNTVYSTGDYNSIPTSITSNTSVVNMVDGLTITKDADKKNWVDGYLTYTIVINNSTDNAYSNPVITDVIDNTLIDFVEGSVKINGNTASSSEYSYNQGNHTLTINLNEVSAQTKTTITFSVKKKI